MSEYKPKIYDRVRFSEFLEELRKYFEFSGMTDTWVVFASDLKSLDIALKCYNEGLREGEADSSQTRGVFFRIKWKKYIINCSSEFVEWSRAAAKEASV